jgi:hypothetical protein
MVPLPPVWAGSGAVAASKAARATAKRELRDRPAVVNRANPAKRREPTGRLDTFMGFGCRVSTTTPGQAVKGRPGVTVVRIPGTIAVGATPFEDSPWCYP